MTIPLVLLVGQAGSGKDTVANYLVAKHHAFAIAQADPLKRLAKFLFDFTDEQLWGPSEMRNAVDPRFFLVENSWGEHRGNPAWRLAFERIGYAETSDWVIDVVGSTSNIKLGGRNPQSYNLDHERARMMLKDWLYDVFEKCKVSGVTPRLVLQTLGTEWGRAFQRDLWVKYVRRNAIALLGGGFRYTRTSGLLADEHAIAPKMVVITDGRFVNEVLEIAQINGEVWRIDCPQADGSLAEKSGIQGHASEQEQKGIPSSYFTRIIVNDKTLGISTLETTLEAIFQ